MLTILAQAIISKGSEFHSPEGPDPPGVKVAEDRVGQDWSQLRMSGGVYDASS